MTFAMFDESGDGALDEEELEKLLITFGQNPSKEKVSLTVLVESASQKVCGVHVYVDRGDRNVYFRSGCLVRSARGRGLKRG